jgi:hypothetical protein
MLLPNLAERVIVGVVAFERAGGVVHRQLAVSSWTG